MHKAPNKSPKASGEQTRDCRK